MSETKENCFKCAHCDGVFEKEWTDEEAKQEFAERFPAEAKSKEHTVVVCDDCYKALLPTQFTMKDMLLAILENHKELERRKLDVVVKDERA